MPRAGVPGGVKPRAGVPGGGVGPCCGGPCRGGPWGGIPRGGVPGGGPCGVPGGGPGRRGGEPAGGRLPEKALVNWVASGGGTGRGAGVARTCSRSSRRGAGRRGGGCCGPEFT